MKTCPFCSFEYEGDTVPFHTRLTYVPYLHTVACVGSKVVMEERRNEKH